jgi:Nucleotidyl transferase AbiEii toxin, Type IV TA system
MRLFIDRIAPLQGGYTSITPPVDDLREGVLLEAGFDTVTPNTPKDISSWAYDYAAAKIDIIDNRAKAVPCYDPRYTSVEKLQTVSTKFRKQQEKKGSPIDFMRHYYDVYSLLKRPEVQAFVGTEAYKEHKAKRFRGGDERDLTKNQAFHLKDPETRAAYEKAYNAASALYYAGKPTLDEILAEIGKWTDRM